MPRPRIHANPAARQAADLERTRQKRAAPSTKTLRAPEEVPHSRCHIPRIKRTDILSKCPRSDKLPVCPARNVFHSH